MYIIRHPRLPDCPFPSTLNRPPAPYDWIAGHPPEQIHCRRQLRIGDDWNAIRIIALSQSNPLKAIAEFVENSIDAHARSVVITRGREDGAHYLSIKDDGDGVPRDDEGLPNFKYVATHICDSIKRHLKTEGKGSGLQGEFGIGLLSFWTVGNTLTMTSAGADQRAYQMTMSKGDSRYKVTQRRVLFAEGGTELKISPLLEGIRSLSGEKIQWFLASELRDRLRTARVAYVSSTSSPASSTKSSRARTRAGCCTSFRLSARPTATPTPSSTWRSRRVMSGGADPLRHARPRESREPAGTRWCTVVVALPPGADRCTVPEPDAGNQKRHHP